MCKIKVPKYSRTHIVPQTIDLRHMNIVQIAVMHDEKKIVLYPHVMINDRTTTIGSDHIPLQQNNERKQISYYLLSLCVYFIHLNSLRVNVIYDMSCSLWSCTSMASSSTISIIQLLFEYVGIEIHIQSHLQSSYECQRVRQQRFHRY